MYFVNGQQADSVTLADRSFNYGDGCFTTILVRTGEIQAWDWHQQRLCYALERLQIELPDWEVIRQWLDEAVNQYIKQIYPMQFVHIGIKLHISRGAGGRGYSPSGSSQLLVTIHPFIYPSYYQDWQQNGVALGISSVKLGVNPLLAGIKHNNRLEQVLIKADIDQSIYQDMVVLDIEQNVIETSAANLFWVKGSHLYTADLARCGVEGTMRKQVLDFAPNFTFQTHIGRYTLAELLEADHVFMTNALHGVVPITSISNYFFSIGVMTRSLQEKLNS